MIAAYFVKRSLQLSDIFLQLLGHKYTATKRINLSHSALVWQSYDRVGVFHHF